MGYPLLFLVIRFGGVVSRAVGVSLRRMLVFSFPFVFCFVCVGALCVVVLFLGLASTSDMMICVVRIIICRLAVLLACVTSWQDGFCCILRRCIVSCLRT